MRATRHIWSRLWQTAAFVALLLTLLTGCGLPWPFPQPTPDIRLPDSQQIFRPLEVGPNAGDLATLDPALINFSSDYDNAQLIFPGLVTLDEQDKPIDWAAERHEVSSDGLTYTFHLRKGMQWSDGTPIDAATFAYSINRTLDPCTGSDVATYLYTIKGAAAFNAQTCPTSAKISANTLIGKSIVVADPLTLKLTLEAPAGYFFASLTYPTSWAVPKQLIEQYGVRWNDHLADNGGFGGNLFKLTRWDHQGHLDFERNERFWGPKPLLRRIEYTLYKDASVAWTAFQVTGTGDVSFPAVANTSDPSGAIGYEIAAARGLKGVTVQQTPQLVVSYMQLRWKRAPFDDARMRQAFSLALDRQGITHEVFHDAQQPTIHLVPEGIPSYNTNLADVAGRKGKDALTADLLTARKLADAYAAEKCSGALANCPAVNILMTANRPTITKIIDLMKQQWQAAFPGLSVTVSTIDRGWHPSGWADQFQITNASWGADYPDPQDFLSLLWTTGAIYNRGSVSIPQVDALCTRADGMSDLSARIPLYQQAEQLLVNQGAAIPYAQPLLTYAVRTRVAGWRVASIGLTSLEVWQGVYIKH